MGRTIDYARRDSNPQLMVPKTRDNSSEAMLNKCFAENQAGDLAFCLALLAKKSADLALLVERWDDITKAVRAGIVAMVNAAGKAPRR
jgi:hypothetical protein